MRLVTYYTYKSLQALNKLYLYIIGQQKNKVTKKFWKNLKISVLMDKIPSTYVSLCKFGEDRLFIAVCSCYTIIQNCDFNMATKNSKPVAFSVSKIKTSFT